MRIGARVLVCLASLLAARPASATQVLWTADQNANSHRLFNLLPPVDGKEPLRLQDVAVGACAIFANGVNSSFRCGVAGTDYGLPFTWPTAGQLVISGGPTTAPAGDSRLTYNTSTGAMVSTGTNVLAGTILAQTATTGFLYIPSINGAPTGVPTSYSSGQAIPVALNPTTDQLYEYNGSWKLIGQYTGGMASGLLKNATVSGSWSIAAAGLDRQQCTFRRT